MVHMPQAKDMAHLTEEECKSSTVDKGHMEDFQKLLVSVSPHAQGYPYVRVCRILEASRRHHLGGRPVEIEGNFLRVLSRELSRKRLLTSNTHGVLSVPWEGCEANQMGIGPLSKHYIQPVIIGQFDEVFEVFDSHITTAIR